MDSVVEENEDNDGFDDVDENECDDIDDNLDCNVDDDGNGDVL